MQKPADTARIEGTVVRTGDVTDGSKIGLYSDDEDDWCLAWYGSFENDRGIPGDSVAVGEELADQIPNLPDDGTLTHGEAEYRGGDEFVVDIDIDA